MKKITDICKENGATILSGLGVIGVASTAVMAAKATPKALDILAEKEEYKQEHYGEPLTRFEKALAVVPVYLPTILMGTATTACILGANHINQVKQANLMAAYTCLDAAYKDYRDKVKDIYGEEAEKKVRDELDKDAQFVEKYGSLHEPKLFYDEFSNRYFEMSIYELRMTIYRINKMFNYLGSMSLNEVYEFVNLKPTKAGETLGWSAHKDWECRGFSWIDITWEKIETPDNLEAYAINFNVDPSKDYFEWTLE